MLINIFGLAGTGKSTLRNALFEKFGDSIAGKVPGDHYLKSRTEGQSLDDFFIGDGYDWKLLQKHLSIPIDTSISTPLYDFTNFMRISETGNKTYTRRSINYLDTVWPCPFADIKILLVADSGLRKNRVITRNRNDEVWKQRTLKKWNPEHDRQMNNQWKITANFVFDGNEEITNLVDKIATIITRESLTG